MGLKLEAHNNTKRKQIFIDVNKFDANLSSLKYLFVLIKNIKQDKQNIKNKIKPKLRIKFCKLESNAGDPRIEERISAEQL